MDLWISLHCKNILHLKKQNKTNPTFISPKFPERCLRLPPVVSYNGFLRWCLHFHAVRLPLTHMSEMTFIVQWEKSPLNEQQLQAVAAALSLQYWNHCQLMQMNVGAYSWWHSSDTTGAYLKRHIGLQESYKVHSNLCTRFKDVFYFTCVSVKVGLHMLNICCQ